jgi:hypothetical protein
MDETIHSYTFSAAKHEAKRSLEDLLTVGRTKLKFILKKQSLRMWTALVWIRIRIDSGITRIQ